MKQHIIDGITKLRGKKVKKFKYGKDHMLVTPAYLQAICDHEWVLLAERWSFYVCGCPKCEAILRGSRAVDYLLKYAKMLFRR